MPETLRFVVKANNISAPAEDILQRYALRPVASFARWSTAYQYALHHAKTGAQVVIDDTDLDREPGDYDWDRWQVAAEQAGVPDELALLGRAVYREAYQHQWPLEIQAECGWYDEGEQMIRDALKDPGKTRKKWDHLLQQS